MAKGLTEVLGIKYPVMQGAMAWISDAGLAAAVSNAGGAGIIGHLEIADRVTVGAMSLVTHDLREPGEYVSGTPIQPKREWRKNAARFGQLDQLARRVRKLLGERNDE